MSFRKTEQEYEERVDLSTLKTHPDNPRDGDVGAIAESIEENGFYGAIGVQRSTKYVLWGNHRYLAARAVGASTLPVFWLDVDDIRAKKILAVDNRANDLAGYKEPELAKLLVTIAKESETGLVGTGYDGDDLDQLLAKIERENRDPDEGGDGEGEGPDDLTPDELIAKYEIEEGGLWRIEDGEGIVHWLTCGDATDRGAFVRLFGGETADLVITDPPYGIAYSTEENEKRPGDRTKKGPTTKSIQGDDLSDDGFRSLIRQTCENIGQHITEQAAVYMFTGARFCHLEREELWVAFRREPKELVWVKSNASFSPEHYARKHELLFYTWKRNVRWFGENNETTILEHHKPASYGYEQDDGTNTNNKNVSVIHPTQKPVDLLVRLITNSSAPGEAVLDCFGGSGSTLIAAHKTGRRAFLIELDPVYVAQTLHRAEKIGMVVEKYED